LGLWLAEATSNRLLGWMASAFLAVFPLNLEAVGWVAAQWDLWAALFGFTSLWLYTKWWRAGRSAGLYTLSLLTYFLGVFSKESLLTFLPIFPLSIWLLQNEVRALPWQRLCVSLLPFAAILLVNFGLRFAYNVPMAYASARSDYGDFFFDSLVVLVTMLIAPINAVYVGKVTQQIVGALVTSGVLLGLVLYGRMTWRLVLLGTIWFTLSVLPVLGVAQNNGDLTNNRYLYLGSAGFCVLIAALLYKPISALLSSRSTLAVATLTALIASGVLFSWLNLQPWHIATSQANSINAQLLRLIPPQVRPQGMVWYTKNLPDNYAGAYIYRLGLGNMRYFTSPTADTPAVVAIDPTVTNLTSVSLNQDRRDAFVIAFSSDLSQHDYHIDYVAGRTHVEELPVTAAEASNLQTWDFTGCAPQAINAWQVRNAPAKCEKGRGLTLTPGNEEPQLISPAIAPAPDQQQAFLRLRVAVRYPKDIPPDTYLSHWNWGPSADEIDADHTRSLRIGRKGAAQEYWSFIPIRLIPSGEVTLRFEPINAKLPAEVQWIASDYVR
jgi:hypothetical protein